MQLERNEKTKYYTVALLVFISFIPFAIFIRNAEGNFRKSDIKKIAEKRRRKLDEEHGVDRDAMTAQYEKLDQMYRISEKEEIRKYLEIGKTPKQYYADQEARGLSRDGDAAGGDGKSST